MRTGTKLLRGWSLAALLIAAAGCGDGPLSPEGDALSGEEVDFLVTETNVILDGLLGGVLTSGEGAMPSVGGPTLSSSSVPVTETFTFVRTKTCPAGGEVILTGSGELTWDVETGTVEMTVEGLQETIDCAYQRGDIVYTVNGSATMTAYRKSVNRELVEAEQITIGSITVVTSDGRRKNCFFRQHAVFDPETNSWNINGNFCSITFANSHVKR